MNYLLSPSSGKVIFINYYPKSNIIHIGIFLNIFDNHNQYVPIDSSVLSIQYMPGKLLPAFLNGTGHNNEKMTYNLYNDKIGLYYIQQIAGVIFRRVMPFVKPGEYVEQGDKLGKILFGSRVDLFIPMVAITNTKERIRYNNLISVGKKLIGGKTIIGLYD